MHDAAGKLQIIPADVKEKLHHLPPGYTQASFLDDTTRHRMLANCWHWGVARRLLACEPDKSFQHRCGHVLILCGLYRHRGFYCSGGVESFLCFSIFKSADVLHGLRDVNLEGIENHESYSLVSSYVAMTIVSQNL